MKVLSIDPGMMTGYCYALLEKEQLLYYPFQVVDDVDDAWRRYKEFRPRYIIIEDFEFRRGKRSAGGLNLFPVQMIGVARLYSMLAPHQCAAVVQKAAQGKAYYSNKVLQKTGLYKRGVPHAMDASRHLLQWCMFGGGNQYIGAKRTEEFAKRLDGWIDDSS
jgi:hypothetical protein